MKTEEVDRIRRDLRADGSTKAFQDADAGLYADEATPEWRVSSYRGQNANMHTTDGVARPPRSDRPSVYLDRASASRGTSRCVRRNFRRSRVASTSPCGLVGGDRHYVE